MARREKSGIHPAIRLVVSACLLLALVNSLSVFVLILFGETTIGTLTSYYSRLDDHSAEANRSRTTSKGYRFTALGKEYQGHVIYNSDEAWPNLRDGEVRRELISYLAVFPYLSKPTHLVDLGVLGFTGLFYHVLIIAGCCTLFVLVNGWLQGKRNWDSLRQVLKK